MELSFVLKKNITDQIENPKNLVLWFLNLVKLKINRKIYGSSFTTIRKEIGVMSTKTSDDSHDLWLRQVRIPQTFATNSSIITSMFQKCTRYSNTTMKQCVLADSNGKN